MSKTYRKDNGNFLSCQRMTSCTFPKTEPVGDALHTVYPSLADRDDDDCSPQTQFLPASSPEFCAANARAPPSLIELSLNDHRLNSP